MASTCFQICVTFLVLKVNSVIKFLTKEGSNPKIVNEWIVAVYKQDELSYFKIEVQTGVSKICIMI